VAYFIDRVDAGKRLAVAMADFKGKDAIVLAIPRGGVVVGYQIATALNLPLDVIIAHKIGAPDNPELAIGAVAEDGSTYLDNQLVTYTGASSSYIKEESDQQKTEIQRRLKIYRQNTSALLSGKEVILVDDGIATGATMKAALASAKNRGAKAVTVAVPVGPPSTIQELRKMGAKQVVCLYMPEWFQAIGQFYDIFDQTSDEEVIDLLGKSRQRNSGKNARRMKA